MALLADHSDLPRPGRSEGEGLMPDESPRFISVLVDSWAKGNDEDKPTAKGTRLRHSDSGKCARALSFTAAGFRRSDPMDLSGVWNVSIGTELHTLWQAALVERFPSAQVEVVVGWGDLDASGHIDAVITLHPEDTGKHRDWTVAYELKTIGGYGWKMAIGKARGPATGPKPEHMAQCAMNALAVDADEMVIGYLSKECVSAGTAGKLSDLGRFAGEWSFSREAFEPIAIAEKARMKGILDLVDSGLLAARKVPFEIPPNAEIVDPRTGRWEAREDGQIVDTGTYYMCAGYCSYRTLCASTESGRIPIESVVAIRGAA
jgi:hypothetical protein